MKSDDFIKLAVRKNEAGNLEVFDQVSSKPVANVLWHDIHEGIRQPSTVTMRAIIFNSDCEELVR